MTLPDEHLMRLVKADDVRAFDALVKRHRPAVTSLARHSCGPDLADDVTQAAFISLWQHRGKYVAGRGTPRSWLLAIARNRGIDMMRSRASLQRHMVCVDPHGWMAAVGEEPQSTDTPDLQVEREESSAEVKRMLEELPGAQRAVIELAYLDGMSQQEIADRLGIPLGTVKGRLRLGLAKLRTAWDREPEPARLATAA
jgi:RNA polymerase sigma-70 factor (ECF subfamily)